MSFEGLVAAAAAWDADFRQISRSVTPSWIQQIQSGRVLLSSGSFGCFVDQRGVVPEGMRTFALPQTDCSEFRWFDHQIDKPVILVFPADREISALTRPGFRMQSFSIPIPILEEHCQLQLDCSVDSVLSSGPQVIQITRVEASKLRQDVEKVVALSYFQLSSSVQHLVTREFETRLLDLIFSAERLRKTECCTILKSAKVQTLNHIFEFLEEHEKEVNSVGDLSAATNIPSRTLRWLFSQSVGISPKKYLLGRRLYGAHRQLWKSSHGEVRVADIANDWGFWHMGQFAKDYRDFFQQLPSDTLKKG